MRLFWLFFLSFILLSSCSNAPEKTKEGFQFLKENKEISALNAFNEALKDDPDHPKALLGVAILMSRNPLTYSIAYRKVQKALEALKNKNDRKIAYEIYAQITDTNESYKENQKNLLKCIEKENIVSEKILYYLARAYRKDKLFKKADQILSKYSKPTMSKVLFYHGVILAQDFYRYPSAFKKVESSGFLKDLTKTNEASRKKKFFLIKLYYKTGEKKKAVHLLDEMRSKDKKNASEYNQIKNAILYYGYRFQWEDYTWKEL